MLAVEMERNEQDQWKAGTFKRLVFVSFRYMYVCEDQYQCPWS